jgi:hypothetical protein
VSSPSESSASTASTKTTFENVDSVLRNIPLLSLPKTFQVTVSLCREFKIRYIWIDSLCIVQDDAVEWRREANRMIMVYGNTFLVLAASVSSGDEIGMFPQPSRPLLSQY